MKHQTNPAIAVNRIYKSLFHSWVLFRVGTPTGTIYSDRFKKNPQGFKTLTVKLKP